MLLLPLLCYWPLVHGFIRFWRRLGVAASLVILWGGMALLGWGVYLARASLLFGDCGSNPWLFGVGILCLSVSTWLWCLLRRDVTISFLVGVPEIAPKTHPQPLIRTGLYARVRHPRYGQLLLSLLGWALLANYLATYLLFFCWVCGVLALVRLEEQELVARFGAEYEEYQRQVPRFLPKWGWR